MRKLLNLFRWKRRRLEQDLDRELRYHFERRVADRISAGLSEEESRRQAQIEFGGVIQVQEEVRDTWIWGWLDDLVRDVRFAFRSLGKKWLFALGAGSVLALGIGANTAIFSVVNTVLLEPLVYPDAERIVSLELLHTNTGRTSPEVSGGDFRDWQAQSSAFEAMAYCFGEDDIATIVKGRAEFANFRLVSPDFFAVFGLPPSAGRLLPRTEQTHTAVVSREWAEAHFGNADAAIGKAVTVYGQAATSWELPRLDSTIRRPRISGPPAARTNPNRASHPYQVVGKLKHGIEPASARSEMQTIGARLAHQYFEDRFTNVTLTPLKEHLTGNVRLTLWLLIGAVSLVLLIAWPTSRICNWLVRQRELMRSLCARR